MYKVKKRIEISAAHNLDLPYPSKCVGLHGHNWIVDIYLQNKTLNEQGMIMDFSHIKTKVIDHLDHKYLNDILPFNTTAENLAKYICDLLQPYCYRVRLFETSDNMAEYIKD